MGWWSSIESLARLNSGVQWIGIIAAGITVFCTILALVSGNRLSYLKYIKQAQAERKIEEIGLKQQLREFTAEQQQSFINDLKSKPFGTVEIIAVLGDGESLHFAEVIEKSLKSAGWSTNGVNQAVFSDSLSGLILVVHSQQTAPRQAAMLQQAFSKIGFTAVGLVDVQVPVNSVKLIVGHKPA